MLVAVQLFVPGLYLPPVFKSLVLPDPPQTIIWLPVHTAVCPDRADGALVVRVAVQLSVLGCIYRRCSPRPLPPMPAQTIISLPVQTAVWP